MTIRYKVGRAMLGGQERLYPKLVPGETVKAKEFERKVAQRAARGLADVSAVLIAEREVLLEELRDEQAVKVPGIGTFTLSLKGELDADQRIVTSSVKLKVNFRPERSLAEGVNADQSFEYAGD
jgi:predicted histone-like DNA-binding protein